MLCERMVEGVMFIYLRGHHLLEYYFSVSDARVAANDRDEAATG
jgi:hypothetical protein